MAARTPRRSFATPFVVTLAAVPAACYVQSGTPPQGPGPQAPPPTNQPPPTTQPDQPNQPPPVMVNPPRPTQPTTTQTEPQTPPPQPPPVAPMSQKWTVYKAKDGTCMAAMKVECQPKATCNPPPPFKYECPTNVALDQPVTVALMPDGQSCQVEYPPVKCPPNVACNPPRPTPVTCPKR